MLFKPIDMCSMIAIPTVQSQIGLALSKSLFPQSAKFIPIFMKLPNLMEDRFNLHDLLWYEVATIAMKNFVLKAANLGGGGPKKQAVNPNPLSVFDVHQSLSPGGDLCESFPCVQTIASALGEVNVRIHVIPSTTSQMQALGVNVNARPRADPERDGSNSNQEQSPMKALMCSVCRTTDSDLRSRSKSGLMKCSACLSDAVKYCSQACQRADWKNHKKVCKAK